MLFVHDVHAVMGEKQFEFEADHRAVFGPDTSNDDVRLLWYLHSAHGSSDAYHVVAITAVRDWEAWDRHVQRLRYGDLAEWSTRSAARCYSSRSTLLVSTPWSPLAALELDDLPTEPPEAGHQLVREDIVEGDGIGAELATRVVEHADGDVVRLAAAFRPALSGDDTVHLLYQVAPTEQWEPAFGADSGWRDWPGSLTEELPEGARGGGRYLHAAPWAPMAKGWS
jgi:hypothetical protein